MSHLQTDIKKKSWHRRLLAKKHRGKLVRYSLLSINAILLIVVVAFVAQKPQTKSNQVNSAVAAQSSNSVIVSPLDELSSADIAVTIAQTTQLEETTSVVNKADTVNAQLTIAPSDNVVTAKPQVIATALKSRADIAHYTVKAGDSATSIAAQFGITSDTVRWSNGLSSDTVNPGADLIISPISGIVYKVAAGDTVDSVSTKYSANRDQVAAFNDAENGSLPVGQYIVIPNGHPATQVARPSVQNVASSGGFAWGGGSAVYGSNGYDYGYCTWWAATRRAQSGRPIPSNLGNASTWKVLAQRAGLGVGNSPQPGAVIWTPPRDYYGHVGYVEAVNGDGSVQVSEMNVAGWGVVSHKTLSAEQAAGFGYIY